jgi:hypothetical protein
VSAAETVQHPANHQYVRLRTTVALLGQVLLGDVRAASSTSHCTRS